MARRKGFAFALVWLTLLVLPASRADQSLRVNAAKTTAELRGDALLVTLAVENPSGSETPARISLDLLDPKGQLHGQAEREERIASGSSKSRLVIHVSGLKSPGLDSVFWYRLRYQILPNSLAGTQVEPVVGIVSVSEIAPEMFGLEYAGPVGVRPGDRFEALIRAVQPAHLWPVDRVKLRATLQDSDNQSAAPLKASTVTDSHGYARLMFVVPENVEAESLTLHVVGERDGYVAELDDREVYIGHFSEFWLSTDKPLYQPGQVLHARVLVFDARHRAVANRPLEFRIYDTESTLVFRSPVTTSNWGIASADWQIPSNARLGSYQVKADFGGDNSSEGGSSTTVKISRYELPTFAVSVKSDRKYYLPSQNAEVDVSANYLFGQPVTRGHARVVRDDEREWNERERKWDVHAGEAYEGETDSSGHFAAAIDLAQEHKEFADDDSFRFHDVGYTAYFTDPTTKRTEQRHFDLRITKHRIHIYVIPSDELPGRNTVDFYVSTFYADGTPAACDVSIEMPQANPRAGPARPPMLLRTIHTNSYGLARVSDLPVPGSVIKEGLTLTFEAKDKEGAAGAHTEEFSLYESPSIRVETDKALYRPGDSIEVKLTSNEGDGVAEVEADSNEQVVTSQMVRLRAGKAEVTLGPNDKFEGPVAIRAYELGEQASNGSDEPYEEGSRAVLFPHDTSLKIDLHISKSTYRPGEKAEAEFHVDAADGDNAKSALGITVVDTAVEERERTDEDLRNNWGFDRFSWARGDDFSGVSRADLDKVDFSKPLPPGLDLVAEILLRYERGYTSFDSSSTPNLHTLFASAIDPPLAPLLTALSARIAKGTNPGGEQGIGEFLAESGLGNLHDPWGTAYATTIAPSGTSYQITLNSAGPDQKLGTNDDFIVASQNWPYFAEYSEAIQQAVEAYHLRTGSYIRDSNVLQAELLKQGLDISSLRDPWGHAYRLDFGIERNFFTVEVLSAGPDGNFSSPNEPSADDVFESKSTIGYFEDTRAKMDAALQNYYQDKDRFPQDLSDLKTAFDKAGIDWDSLHDPWGNPYYSTFRQEAQYSDSVIVESYSEYQAGQHTAVRPVTASINYVDIRSTGPDGKEGTADDFVAATFSRAIYQQAGRPGSATPPVVFSGTSGAISGTVTDPIGAVIVEASVTATRYGVGEVYRTKSDDVGHYLLRNLKPGAYEVRFVRAGFRDSVFTQVPVGSPAITQLNAVMQVGSVNTTVTVTETAGPLLQTDFASVSEAKAPNTTGKSGLATAQITPLSTPRLREYFPETLLWQPELLTNARGVARLTFPLADSITTWNLEVVASTADGRIGTVKKEVRVFQPFFADQDLPQFLTDGDKIDLPVVVRNFLPSREEVTVSLDPQAGLRPLASAVQHTEIGANNAARLSFPIVARTPTPSGIRVTAIGRTASDAVEKKTTVRPFGEEEHVTDSQILGDSAVLNVSIPSTALPGSTQAELKVYPNLMAHVWEAITAISKRPWGCGEQTISSTYPSILILQYAKRAGRENSPEVLKARRFAQLGYDRLLSYATEDGGFSYWGRGDAADLSLTAYAVMFLRDAREVISVDDSAIRNAESFLLKQMKPEGYWPAKYYWTEEEDTSRRTVVTAYIACVLASRRAPQPDDSEGQKLADVTRRDLATALAWLGPRVHQQDEPYLIASYALALLETGDPRNRTLALQALSQLKSLTHHDGDAMYWSIETNTPFYGWGRAGRLETTALVVEAFERTESDRESGDRSPIDGGLLYLLRNQDQYGIWYSTQATFNVLRALADSVSTPAGEPAKNAETSAVVLVDGKPVTSMALPPAGELSAPVVVDLSRFMAPGDHRVQVTRPAGSAKASVQLATTFYLPWTQYSANQALHREAGSAEALRLAVKYDRTDAKVGESVTCTVKAERVDFHGYGMMLGEIGLPPGAEVNRASLDKAMTGSNWEINDFDVLPDRIIVYLWPHAGGTTFSFTFTTRFGVDAETTPSVLYDYYNPDARAVLKPTHLIVH
ncbi:MAG TPA: MG2 domain-containing protein [Candidatus Limnocylindrales bacterium]|nr:MG2 domain-containing protein [Candidatus Limnocylindrales bacterium]